MASFYSYFAEICNGKGVSMNKACLDMNISRTSPQKWKGDGKPNADTIETISKYFDIPFDEIRSLGAKKEPPTGISERNYKALLKLDGIIGNNRAFMDEVLEYAMFRESKMGKG